MGQDSFSDLLAEVAVEVEGTADGLETREAIDGLQSSVVGKLKTTTNGLELRHGDVSQILVADESKSLANEGEVRRGERLKEVGVESHRAIDRGERWDADLGDVAEGHVVGPLKVGEDCAHVAAVGLEDEGVGDVAELHVDVVEVGVVRDGHRVNDLQVDAV